MQRFDTRPDGPNAKPHILRAFLDPHAAGGVSWTIKCPYEGPRECGLVEECTGSDKDVQKWGCEPFPTPPSDYGDGGPEEDRHAAWEAFEAARDRWENEVHGGRKWHRTEQCWFEHAIGDWDFEPEYYLSTMTGPNEKLEISSPIQVAVGYDGYDEDTEPLLRPWTAPTEEASDAEKS